MITTLIVEDEQPARERLESFINKNPELKLAGCCSTGQEAIDQINARKPQIVFLDIKLPDISGIDVLKVIDWQPVVVFTTAFDRYALDAFNFSAVDFLLKPYSEERFRLAVQKALQRVALTAPLAREIGKLLSEYQSREACLKRIPSKIGERIFIINVEDIVYFSSDHKLVNAHLFDKNFLINYTLEELQNRLEPDQFFRIHRSTIVNLDYIKTIEPGLGGTYLMKVKDHQGSGLNISRSAARHLREKLGW